MSEITTSETPLPQERKVSRSPQATAVHYLSDHGYEHSTTSELADAIGMSRSTFFRRFGSKEDVVFSDHDRAISHLEEHLAASDRAPYDTIAAGTLEVTHALTHDPVTARLRSELLRNTPSLRERELVITHRYERVFTKYLSSVAAPGTPEWAPIALAAAIVAVHNLMLRRWLRDGTPGAFEALGHDLMELMTKFAPWFGGERTASRVVAAAFSADASPDEVLRVIASQLGR